MKRLFYLIPFLLWASLAFATAPVGSNWKVCEGFSPVTCTFSGSITSGVLIGYDVDWTTATGTIAVTDNCNAGSTSNTYSTVDAVLTGTGTSSTTGGATAAQNVGAGLCTVTFTQSGGASLTAGIWVVTNGILDVHAMPSPAFIANPSSGSVTTSGTDYCIGWAIDGNLGGHTLSAGTNVAWAIEATQATFPGSVEDFTQTSSGAITAQWGYGANSGTFGVGIICYKPVPPTGPPSTLIYGGSRILNGSAIGPFFEPCLLDTFVDFSSSGAVNGTVITQALLNTHSPTDGTISGSWGAINNGPATGFTYQSSAQQTLINSVGCPFYLGKGSGLLGVQWATAGGTGSPPWPDAPYNFTSTGTCGDFSVNEEDTVALTDTHSYSLWSIEGTAGNDYAIWQLHAAGGVAPPLWQMECKSSNVGSFTHALNTLLLLRVHYQGGGTHTGYIYDNNPADAVSGVAPLLYSVSCPAISTIAGSVTSGTFTAGETVKQSVTLAQATEVAPGPPLQVFSITGSPDNSHTWVGQTSSAVFTPTGLPAGVLPIEAIIGPSGAEPEVTGFTISYDSMKVNATSCAAQTP